MARNREIWIKCVVAYTVAGAVSAMTVGFLLGAIGRKLGTGHLSAKLFVLAALYLVLALRDLGCVRFPLPERRCQTEKVWAHQFGFGIAAAMWGFHIGLSFATWATFGSSFIVATFSLIVGDPVFAGVLMLTYWLGRVIPLWMAPILISSGREAVESPAIILKQRRTYQRMSALALTWSTITILLMLIQPMLKNSPAPMW